MTTDRMSSKKSGFTLIELLVVIAIIAILAAILFPVFAQAREKARAITCVSNQKQVALGLLMYVQDFDETLPPGLYNDEPATPTAGVGLKGAGWAGQIAPYEKSTGIFSCPDDPTNAPTGTTPGLYKISYAFNSNLPSEKIAQFSSPASTVLTFEVQGSYAAINLGDEGIAETGHLGNSQLVPLSPVGNGVDIGSTSGSLIDAGSLTIPATGGINNVRYATGITNNTYRNHPGATDVINSNNGTVHTGGSNFGMDDGHVKYLPPSLVSTGENAVTTTDTQNTVDAEEAAGTGGLGPYSVTFSIN